MSPAPIRVAVCTMPTTGHVNPLLPVLAALVERGAEVSCTSTPETADKLAATGVALVDYPAGVGEIVEEPASGLAEICRLLVAATELTYPSTYEWLERTRPDVVLVDSIAPWGRLAAEKLGIPAVTSCSTFAVTSDLDPSWRGKVDLAREIVLGAPQLARWAWGRRRLQRRFGIDSGDPVTMFAGRADKTIVYVSRELQPGGDSIGDDVEFVGSAIHPASPDHPDLADLPDGPLIYISLGTRLNDRPDFLRSCLEAFADHDGPVLLSIGTRTDIAELGTLPANAIVRRWVPQLNVLARADLFVTHAGMNSTCESLVHGVPMLMYPQTADQPRVAARVAKLGAGVVLRGDAPTAAEIRTAGAVARQPDVRARAAKLGAGLMTGGGTDRAADVVLAMVGTEQPTG